METEIIDQPNLQEYAIRQIETTKQVYKLSPERMFSEYRGEKENVTNYNGRQLLEMLQNADDAASKARKEKKVLINLNKNQLVIANTGYPFSEDGLKSIFHSHLSPKQALENQIGKKGLGFRSILSWANKVTIKSHDLCVAFSKIYSKKVLDELLTDDVFKSKYEKSNSTKDELPISTLVCPEIVDETDSFLDYTAYDTVILIDLKEKAYNEVLSQIEKDLDGEVLIFLNNIELIELNINGEIINYEKQIINKIIGEVTTEICCPECCLVQEIIIKDNDKDEVMYLKCEGCEHNIEIEMNMVDTKFTSNLSVKLINIENRTSTERIWNVNTISGYFQKNKKTYELSLAWKDELDQRKEVIYSYFRTNVPFQFPGILHGTFELNADRSDIVKDEDGYNNKLIELIPFLVADTSVKIANKEIEGNYKALSITLFDYATLPTIIRTSNFINNLKITIKRKPILPTIFNKYISFNNIPVYYKDQIFAELLKFGNIVKICNNIHILNYYENEFNSGYYSFKTLCNSIANKRKELTLKQYASLILAIINTDNKNVKFEIDEAEDIKLFFDSEYNLLSFKKPIFLPAINIKNTLPEGIGVQIINAELAEELKKLAGVNYYESLTEKLSYYKIKTFNFDEVIKLLLNHFNSSNRTNKEIIELNKYIYYFYKNEKHTNSKWAGTSIPLINKNKRIELGCKLYFVVEYGEIISDTIYSYDNNKLLLKPSGFEIDENEINTWKLYLEWCGVAKFPRTVQIDSTSEFADYVMRTYDFRNKIADYHFKNFADFKNSLSWYPQIKVNSIDDIDNILNFNSSENILAWLYSDNELYRQIKDDKETNISKISFNFYRAQYPREINGSKMKNYLKWKMSNSSWLKTKSGGKQSPCLCTVSATITEDFSPLIEKPNINSDSEIFIKCNIRQYEIESLLFIIGVNETISSFETKILFSILFKLPEIDIEGKKAKTIYNELATNYDIKNLDTSDNQYVKFKEKGLVLCKKNEIYSYESTNNVFYVHNKKYGESVINRFFTIEIARNKNQNRIEKIFGVKTLKDLKISLLTNPIIHQLNGKFEQEIENFKPYVYVLRQDADQYNEKALIKGVKFKLVTQLTALLKGEEEDIQFELMQYEYLHLYNNKTIYINIPTYIDDEKKLKDDVPFCSTLADAFSTLLEIDSQELKIRELFRGSTTNRDDIIRCDLDDPKLEKLNKARESLGIVNNPKIQFWKSLIKCFPTKKIRGINFTEESLMEEIISIFPQNTSIISESFNQIIYDDCNEEQSLRLIVQLFKEIGLTTSEFNKYTNQSIDLSEIYDIDFKRIKEEKRGVFKQYLFSQFMIPGRDKKQFLKYLFTYDSIIGNCKNEIQYNVFIDLNNIVYNTFNIDLNTDINEFNFEKILSNNKMNYERAAESENIPIDIALQFLTENQDWESLLYFEGEIVNLILELKKWVPKPDGNSPKPSGTPKKRITIGNTSIFYNNYFELFSQLENEMKKGETFQINLSKIKIKRTDIEKSNRGKSKPAIGTFSKPKKTKEDVGFLGEYLVYKHLLTTIKNKESIKWISEYAKEAGVISDFINGKGYDIEYIPNDAKFTRYVEVKTVGWDNAFHITSNEVSQGEKLKKHYEIFLVRNITEPENISIEIIQGPFDYKGQKSFTDNELFTVINDSFILKFEKLDN